MKKQSLYQARMIHRRETEKLGQIDNKVEDTLAFAGKVQEQQLDVEMFKLVSNYHHDLMEQRAEQVLMVEDAQQGVTSERGKLVAVQRRRKTLERLKEKQWDLYYQNFLRAEQKELDDIGRDRFCRKEDDR